MFTLMVFLLLLGLAVALGLLMSQRARKRRFREFTTTAGRTLQMETCGGIATDNLYEYLLALAMALRTQAMLRHLKLQSGEFEQIVTDAIESAYLLQRDSSGKDSARASLSLFAFCLDPVMSKTRTGDHALGDEGNFVGTSGAIAMLASIGWHAESNADLVTCALTETSMDEGVVEYWRSRDQTYRDRVEASFEQVFRTALDPATATYMRHKAFSGLRNAGRSVHSKIEQKTKAAEA